MKIYGKNALILFILACLLLSSCAPHAAEKSTGREPSLTPSVSESKPPLSSPKNEPSQSAASVTPSATPSDSPPVQQPTDDIFSPGILPVALPALTENDKKVFDPDKILSYLAAGIKFEHNECWYTLDKAELKDKKLYLDITLNLVLMNVDTAYQYLKESYALPDEAILKIPLFSECVIHDGMMYADKNVWEDRKTYASYDEWVNSREGFTNSFVLREIKLSSLPVADDAKITLYGEDGHYDLTMEQFIEHILKGKNSESNFIAEDMHTMDYLYLSYSGGQITSLLQDSGDI